MSNFTKAGSEGWQSTLTRAPLFPNLFFDRLAALGFRAVNAPFRSLCFAALFDQVVDLSPSRARTACGYVLAMWWPFAFSRTLAAFSAFLCRSS